MRYIKTGLLMGLLMNAQFIWAEANDYEAKARAALQQIVQEQIADLKQTTNNTSSGNEDNIKGFVLTTHIRSFSDIPQNIDAEIKAIRERIRLLIRRVATDIEASGGNSGTLSLSEHGDIQYKSNPNLPTKLNQKRQQLMQANLKNSVSVRSAVLAINMLVGINDSLKQRASSAKTRQQKEQVYMTQAIYVYEMADIVLELFNNLSLEGKNTIETLHKDAQTRVDQRISDIDQQLQKAQKLTQQGLLSPAQLQQEQHTYAMMRQANNQSLDSWKKLIQQLSDQQNFLDNLQKKKALIEHKRDKAKTQLETLRDLRQVAELKDTIGSLDDLVTSIGELDLLILDENTVRSLLGYSIDG